MSLNEVTTHFSAQLLEANPKEIVSVAGMITRFRTHQTRNGKTMAFATLEDIQGEIELVIFPRKWEQVSNLIEVDKLIAAEGRIDENSSEPKLLVNKIKTDLKITTSRHSSAPAHPSDPAAIESQLDEAKEPPQQAEIGEVSEDMASREEIDPDKPPAVGEIREVEETPIPYYADQPPDLPIEEDHLVTDWGEEDQGIPPQPDIFPPDWELASAVMSAVEDPESAIDLAQASHAEPLKISPEHSETESPPDALRAFSGSLRL